MQITIVVGGRFHAFDLAYQLQKKNINYKLITSYPLFILKRFNLIRKNAAPGGGHGNDTLGYEILHTNIEGALTNLGFKYDAFDHLNTPLPQSYSYISWLKSKLAQD